MVNAGRLMEVLKHLLATQHLSGVEHTGGEMEVLRRWAAGQIRNEDLVVKLLKAGDLP